MIKIICKENNKLLKYLTNNEGLNFNKIWALFRAKNIKINGKRAKSDDSVSVGDEVVLFCKDNYFFNIEKIFEDENVLIVSKPKKLEVISETKNISLINILCSSGTSNLFCVHRLDFNTEGIVVFAKNIVAKNILDNCFKTRQIEKKYITICKNIPSKSEILFKDYLTKENNFVKISSKKTPLSKEVLTKCEIMKTTGNFSLLKISLLTGRTHQIRAHLAFHKLFVLGDDKYGDFNENKKLNLSSQILRCIELSFPAMPKPLNNLSGKTFCLDYSDILSFFETL